MAKKVSKHTLLFYLIIFSFMIIATALTLTTTQLSCNRIENVCYIKKAHLWEFSYKPVSKVILSDIQSAIQTSYQSRDSRGHVHTHYKTVLKTKRGNINVFNGASNTYIQKINHYLTSQANDLEITEDRGFYYAFFLGFSFLFFIAIYIDLLMIKRHKTHPVIPSKYSLNKLSYKYLLKRQNIQSYQSASPITEKKPQTEKQLRSHIFNHLKKTQTFNAKLDTKTDEHTSVSQPNGGVERF